MASMDMVYDEVLTSLDETTPPARHKISLLALATFLCFATIMGTFSWILIAGDPHGGRPRVVMALTPTVDMADAEILLSESGIPLPVMKPTFISTDMLPTVSSASVWQEPVTDEGSRLSPGMQVAVPLRPAPDPALIERGSNGSLPIIAADGRRAMDVYARPFNQADPRPRIAIVLRGMGLNQSATVSAIEKLPPDVTLSFVPYPENLQSWVNRARKNGHEVMLELPMEPFDFPNSDPGPFTLLTSLDQASNTKRLEWLLSRVTGYVGVTNYLGEKFTTTQHAFAPVLESLQERGLLYLADGPSQHKHVESTAQATGLEWLANNSAIDYSSAYAVENDLLKLEEVAREKGFAVGTSFAFPVSIEQIAEWAESLDQKGIALAPVTAIQRP